MIFLGIDQTGAIDNRGQPKPLAACVLIQNELRFFYLKKFNRRSLDEILGPKEIEQLQICIDCVLGLPKELKLSWRKVMQSTSKTPGYGRLHAQAFFKNLIHRYSLTKIPRREIEIVCHANSVFLEKPYQKNIQTGTFRFWKEMAEDPDWFYIPRLSGEKRRLRSSARYKRLIPIAEGYPSLAWRVLFKVKKREPEAFFSRMRENFPEVKITRSNLKLLKNDSNLADAAVLALIAKKAMPEDNLGPSTREGSILGSTQRPFKGQAK